MAVSTVAMAPADAVVALDAKTFKELQRFDVGTDPERFVVTRDGSRLYSANEDAGTATVTDVRKNKVTASLVMGIEPEGAVDRPATVDFGTLFGRATWGGYHLGVNAFREERGNGTALQVNDTSLQSLQGGWAGQQFDDDLN